MSIKLATYYTTSSHFKTHYLSTTLAQGEPTLSTKVLVRLEMTLTKTTVSLPMIPIKGIYEVYSAKDRAIPSLNSLLTLKYNVSIVPLNNNHITTSIYNQNTQKKILTLVSLLDI